MRIILFLLIAVHGLIHLLGFAKAFYPGSITQLRDNVSKPAGVLWLIATILFITSAFMFWRKGEYWWVVSLIAVVLSQYLVISSWHDAKAGTILNVVVLLVAVVGYFTWNYHKQYKDEVNSYIVGQDLSDTELLTETDIQALPVPVQKYLRYTGCLNKPKVKNFKIVFSGQIRGDEDREWMPFRSEQYNFLDKSTRLFFMTATMKKLPVAGFHDFQNGVALMDIRLLSMFRVIYEKGREMNESETVTFFNDMCCMAPATLIDKRISWKEIDSNTVEAVFTSNGISITAELIFDGDGALRNFISDNRYAATKDGLKNLQWSTPLKDYKLYNGYKLLGYADVIYKYPDGDFCYGNFRLQQVEYNVEQ